MAFFPSSPTLNQKATVFNREWVYDGRRWKRVRLTAETITLTKLLDVDTSTVQAGQTLVANSSGGFEVSTITATANVATFTTSTTDGDGDYFVVVDTSNNQRKLAKGSINISGFNNNSGYITASSTATLTNKSGNISQWTNNSGYITSSGSANNATHWNNYAISVVSALPGTPNANTIYFVTG